jgi:uncharacterized protein (TIGR00730 family)
MKKSLKAYKNPDFLNSREARPLRILSEYLEPEKRFEEMNVQHTVVFFGSSRIRPDKKDKRSVYYWAAEKLAFKLASWFAEHGKKGESLYICTGGGPGIMEAANRGAGRAKAKTIGLNISLPFEQRPNKYITPELNFEFHYFFMRKLWFLYHAKALVIFPGGYGTLDELFEILTLVQTGKLEKRNIPILMCDKNYWDKIINFQGLVDNGYIAQEDIDLIRFFSTPEEGFDLIKKDIEKLIKSVDKYLEGGSRPGKLT